MSFHACNDNDAQIPLPKWVTDIGDQDPDIFYKDYDGNPDGEYLSWAVDEELLANGLRTKQVIN
jgi:beta-amylase